MGNKKPTIRVITEKQWKKLQQEIRDTIYGILESAEVIIEHTQEPSYGRDNTPLICSAIYTHAIEEYGKLVYVQSCKPVNGNVKIEYSDKFTNHNFKLNLAYSKLPESCTTLAQGSFTQDSFSPNSFTTQTTTNWNTRLDILNTDIDSNGNVNPTPRINLDDLSKAISEFRTEFYKIRIDE